MAIGKGFTKEMGGGYYKELGTDITLGVESGSIVTIKPISDNLTVKLPDARCLPLGKTIYCINEATNRIFNVAGNGGGGILSLQSLEIQVDHEPFVLALQKGDHVIGVTSEADGVVEEVVQIDDQTFILFSSITGTFEHAENLTSPQHATYYFMETWDYDGAEEDDVLQGGTSGATAVVYQSNGMNGIILKSVTGTWESEYGETFTTISGSGHAEGSMSRVGPITSFSAIGTQEDYGLIEGNANIGDIDIGYVGICTLMENEDANGVWAIRKKFVAGDIGWGDLASYNGNLKHVFPFDEISETKVALCSLNNGNLINESPNISYIETTNGKRRGKLVLSASSSLNTKLIMDTYPGEAWRLINTEGDLTVDWWMKFQNGLTGGGGIFVFYLDGNYPVYPVPTALALHIYHNKSTLQKRASSGAWSFGWQDELHGHDLRNNRWFHFVFRVTGGNCSFWINGQQKQTCSFETSSAGYGDFKLDLTTYVPTKPICIDEMHVWQAYLGDSDIAYLYNGGRGRFYGV